jgi:hypothetical protein
MAPDMSRAGVDAFAVESAWEPGSLPPQPGSVKQQAMIIPKKVQESFFIGSSNSSKKVVLGPTQCGV